jgi:hypothetical protein
MGLIGFLNFVQHVCLCMNDGHGASNDGHGALNDGQGALNDGQGALNDGQGASNDGQGTSNEGQGASNDGQGASNDGQGASNEGQGASNDGQGASNDGRGASNDDQGALNNSQGAPNDSQGASNDGQGASTRSQPISINRTPSPPAGCYRVFHVLYLRVPSHEAIFIETHEIGNLTGHLYHVVGNILEGMKYEDKEIQNPTHSASFEKMSFIGVMLSSDIPRLDAVCRSVEIPGKQLNLRSKRLDPSKPLRRCGEWTADAISALHQQGIVRQ